jgi:hypothetical protein
MHALAIAAYPRQQALTPNWQMAFWYQSGRTPQPQKLRLSQICVAGLCLISLSQFYYMRFGIF